MAVLSVISIGLTGNAPAMVAASAGGDSFANDAATYLHVKNAGGATCNVTVASPTPCSYGFSHPVAVAVAAGAERYIGPFPIERFGSTVSVTYDQVATVTVEAVKVR